VTSPLRILLLEDNARDAELIQDILEGDHFVCRVTRVQTRVEFLAGLKTAGIDLILADYKLPSFDGLSALRLALIARPELPFIFVSGTLGEEQAIEALKFGATDYVLKTRLSRLVPSVQRALREAQERVERKKAEAALRRSEMYLAEAQRLSHTGSFGWDPVSREIYWSDETYRIFEYEPTTKPTFELMIDRTHPDDRMRLRQVIDRAAIEGREFTAEHRLMMADGSVKYVRAVARRSTGESPERLIFRGAITDITERKRAEDTVQEQANLLSLTHDAIFVRDMNGVITYWNPAAEALYGWTAEQAKGKAAAELLKTVFPVPFGQIMAELLSRGHWEGELVHTKKDGTQVTVASRWSLQRDEQGAPIAALETNNDVTERKRAEEALRRSEKELRDVIETIPAMAFSTLPDGSTEFINRRWFEYSGLSIKGTSRSGWQVTVHPDDLHGHASKWQTSLASGEPFENEVRHRSVNGEYRWFLIRAVPLRDECGHLLKWYGTLTDIEDRKRAEEERERLHQLQADLAHVNRVSMMGELAASLAHEIKQPIAAAIMNAEACMQWLGNDVPDVTEACQAASAIVANATRATEIIDRVRSLYKRGRPKRELVDVNEVVREMTVLLGDAANRNSISIRTELDLRLPTTIADRVQLQQVLMNLLLNGIEAMQETGGELIITSKTTENGQLLISVRDSGVGLSIEDVERIFEAFFTRKPQGTGIGLSISRRIIESHGGRLWASANTVRGATFQFTLPSEVTVPLP
jgi:PAS domain S-box-containing protein